MKEARIILPLFDNDGVDLQAVHDDLKAQLCETFGGYTALPSMGGWMDRLTGRLYQDPGIAYDVACEDSVENDKILRDIALYLAHKAHQECIYLRLPSGTVEFIHPEAEVIEFARAA